MGIKTVTTEICTCDMCGNTCNKDEGNIKIKVNHGDRDVGPAHVVGRIVFNQPYGCDNGIICTQCKIKWLTSYLRSFVPQESTKDVFNETSA